jgi:hypothetical protein
MLHSKYQSERRLEEAVIVKRLVHREQKQKKIQDIMMIRNTRATLLVLVLSGLYSSV